MKHSVEVEVEVEVKFSLLMGLLSEFGSGFLVHGSGLVFCVFIFLVIRVLFACS